MMIMIFVLGAIACNIDKTPITVDEFYSKAGDFGCKRAFLSMGDDLEAVIKDSAFISKEVNGLVVMLGEFYIANDSDSANMIFAGTKENLTEAAKTNIAYVVKEGSSGNYAYYKLTNDGVRHVLCMVGDTVLYLRADSEYANEADDFAKAVGY